MPTLTHTCTLTPSHTACQDDEPVKEGVPSGHSPGIHGAGETEERTTEVQDFLPTPSLHQLHPSTLHTEVSVEGEQLENVYGCVWVGGWGVS